MNIQQKICYQYQLLNFTCKSQDQKTNSACCTVRQWALRHNKAVIIQLLIKSTNTEDYIVILAWAVENEMSVGRIPAAIPLSNVLVESHCIWLLGLIPAEVWCLHTSCWLTPSAAGRSCTRHYAARFGSCWVRVKPCFASINFHAPDTLHAMSLARIAYTHLRSDL